MSRRKKQPVINEQTYPAKDGLPEYRLYIPAGRKSFYIHWTVPGDGRSGSESFSTRKQTLAEAEVVYKKWRAQELEVVTQGGITYHDCATYWLQRQGPSRGKKSREVVEYTAKLWGHLPPSALGTRDMEARIPCEVPGARRPGTINRYARVVKSVLNYAARGKNGLIKPADLPDFETPAVPSGRRTVFLPEKEEVLLLQLAHDWQSSCKSKKPEVRETPWFFYALLAAAGGRFTATLELTWERVHPNLLHTVDLQNGKEERNKKKVAVYLDEEDPVLAVLEDFHARRGHPTSGPVFDVGESGMRKRLATFRRAIADQVPWDETIPHAMRHTSVTRMLRQGVDSLVVAEWHGNTVKQIQSTYGHIRPDHFRAVRKAARERATALATQKEKETA